MTQCIMPPAGGGITRCLFVCALGAVALATGCASPQGTSPQAKRDYVLQMRTDSLNDLYSKRPELKSQVESAPGYAMFSSVGAQVIFLGGGKGFGVVHDNKTGTDTYMKMVDVSAGLGLGVNDFRAVFVFNDERVLRDFIGKGWEFGAGAAAQGKVGEKGEGTSGGVSANPIDIYQFTDGGVMLKATLSGTKYYPDKELNPGG